MKVNKSTERYVAFLRGINVGGHHKVPMAELHLIMEEQGFENVITLLNSGNVIFDSTNKYPDDLEKIISKKLEKTFNFSVPTIIRDSKSIMEIFNDAPFQHEEMHKDIRLYISFLRKQSQIDLATPWASSDNAYRIIEIRETSILSVLDLSVSKTTNTMENLEKIFGKDITTRNWNTIERIVNKI